MFFFVLIWQPPGLSFLEPFFDSKIGNEQTTWKEFYTEKKSETEIRRDRQRERDRERVK